MKSINWLCIFQGTGCIYSIKKVLAVFTMALITYLAVFTVKDYYELLLFVASLLALRSYDKAQAAKNDNTNAV